MEMRSVEGVTPVELRAPGRAASGASLRAPTSTETAGVPRSAAPGTALAAAAEVDAALERRQLLATIVGAVIAAFTTEHATAGLSLARADVLHYAEEALDALRDALKNAEQTADVGIRLDTLLRVLG